MGEVEKRVLELWGVKCWSAGVGISTVEELLELAL